MKRRRVIGYEEAIKYLKKGNEIFSFPMYDNWYMCVPVIDGDKYSQEYMTIRNDALDKLIINRIIKRIRMEHYTTIYGLNEKEVL